MQQKLHAVGILHFIKAEYYVFYCDWTQIKVDTAQFQMMSSSFLYGGGV